MQTGKTRWTHYSIAYHFVWIPKDRRKILTGDVQKATKDLLNACCQRHGLALLALETDLDHVHLFVSAPPRFSPAQIANLLKGYTSRYLRSSSPISRSSAAQTFCRPKPTLLAPLARFRLKPSGAILLSVKKMMASGLSALSSLSPNGDGNSRAVSLKDNLKLLPSMHPLESNFCVSAVPGKESAVQAA